MVSFRLEFSVNEKTIDTFLLGSKQYFEIINKVVKQFSKAIDVVVEFKYKLIEIEKSKIIYRVSFYIDYPTQGLLWGGFNNMQIDSWMLTCIEVLFNRYEEENIIDFIKNKADELALKNNFIFMEIIEENIKKNLEELKKMSILLFKNLYYFEDKGRKSE